MYWFDRARDCTIVKRRRKPTTNVRFADHWERTRYMYNRHKVRYVCARFSRSFRSAQRQELVTGLSLSGCCLSVSRLIAARSKGFLNKARTQPQARKPPAFRKQMPFVSRHTYVRSISMTGNFTDEILEFFNRSSKSDRKIFISIVNPLGGRNEWK